MMIKTFSGKKITRWLLYSVAVLLLLLLTVNVARSCGRGEAPEPAGGLMTDGMADTSSLIGGGGLDVETLGHPKADEGEEGPQLPDNIKLMIEKFRAVNQSLSGFAESVTDEQLMSMSEDELFVMLMLPLEDATIAMAQTALETSSDIGIRNIAKAILSRHNTEKALLAERMEVIRSRAEE